MRNSTARIQEIRVRGRAIVGFAAGHFAALPGVTLLDTTATAGTPVATRRRRAMAGRLLAVAPSVAANWLALCLVAASYRLPAVRRAAVLWLLAGATPGSPSSPWTCSTPAERRLGSGAHRAVELVSTIVTLALPLRPALDLGQS